MIYRGLEEKQNFLYRIKKDGSGRERISNANILQKVSVSPGGDWVIAGVSVPGEQPGVAAVSVRNGEIVKICTYECPVLVVSGWKDFLYHHGKGRQHSRTHAGDSSGPR